MVRLRTSLSGSVSDFGSLASTSSDAASGLGRGVGPGVPVPVSISTDADSSAILLFLAMHVPKRKRYEYTYISALPDIAGRDLQSYLMLYPQTQPLRYHKSPDRFRLQMLLISPFSQRQLTHGPLQNSFNSSKRKDT